MENKKIAELKPFLEEKVDQYNNPDWIHSDPIQIPHNFEHKEDIEITAFFAATLAWGQRLTIINKSREIMEIMGNSPYDFVMNYNKKNTKILEFKHRTFNGIDLDFFIRGLKHIYTYHDGLESLLKPKEFEFNYFNAIDRMRVGFCEVNHHSRSLKHLSSPAKGSAAKRLIMFLRWMVRQDNSGVDFGIWKSHEPHKLSCPLDVHSGKVARSLGLLSRKQNDRKAVEELDETLRALDPKDPSKYDYALFGLGAFENFLKTCSIN